MKTGVITTFYCWSTEYSLTSVVEAQLTALVKYGYSPVLFVLDNFKDDEKVPRGVEIRKTVPRFLLVDYSANQEVAPEVTQQAEKVVEFLKENTKDIDVIIEHDLIFQGWFLPYAIGIHAFAKTSNIKWLHWIHSNPSGRPANIGYPHLYRYELPVHSKLVYLNNIYLIKTAETYGAFPKDVRVVYNPVDPRLYFSQHPLIGSLIDKYDILAADFLQIYPISTTRMVGGKGIYILIDIFAKLKENKKRVCLIVCNAHANDKREKQTIAEVISYASQRGLSQSEIIFTSLEEPPTYELGVPREVVSQLFRLANLFVFPSISENCSLILLEAMLAKNLLVLNESVPPMREFGKENALYFKFGGQEETVNYQDKSKWLDDVARIIIAEFNTNKALKAANEVKKNFNYDYIFKQQIEPLLHEL